MSYLLDTNILSLAFKQNIPILQQLEVVKTKQPAIYMSCISYFEIKRGLLAVKATKKIEIFNEFSQDYEIIF
ncbi:MAG: hypothetical protein AB4062_00430 [Crocosphaera sp.]